MQSTPITNGMSIKMHGMRELNRAFKRLPDELKKSGEKAVLRAGAKPINVAAKAKAPVGTGLLKKSIGTNVKKVDGEVTARVGPRSGWKQEVTRNGQRVVSDPNKYSHLLEFGTSSIAARPFIRPAIDSTRGQVVGAMAVGLDKYVARAVQRVKSRA